MTLPGDDPRDWMQRCPRCDRPFKRMMIPGENGTGIEVTGCPIHAMTDEMRAALVKVRDAVLQQDEQRFVRFGAAIRDARVEAGVSLRSAAALLGTTAVRLGEVERGVRRTTESEGDDATA